MLVLETAIAQLGEPVVGFDPGLGFLAVLFKEGEMSVGPNRTCMLTLEGKAFFPTLWTTAYYSKQHEAWIVRAYDNASKVGGTYLLETVNLPEIRLVEWLSTMRSQWLAIPPEA